MLDVYLHWAEQRIFDNEGRGSRRATKKLVEQIKTLKPDLIHIHLIHDHYLNYQILFEYLSSANIPVVWTQHDSWNLTGHCYHFVTANCDRWKTECHDCPLIHSYPNNLLDRSRKNYHQKREAFTSVENLNIVSCSHWLDNFVTYGSFCRIECAPIPYKHRHSERFKVLSCKIELFNSSIGHFAG